METTYSKSSKGLRDAITQSRSSGRDIQGSHMADRTNMIMNARSSKNYGKKAKASNLNYEEIGNKKASTVALPDIGSDSEVICKLKNILEEAKNELREKDLKMGALQRNFESLSQLCQKSEGEKYRLQKVKEDLTQEVRTMAGEILEHLQTIKKLQAEIEAIKKGKDFAEKARHEIESLKDKVRTLQLSNDQKDKKLEWQKKESASFQTQIKALKEQLQNKEEIHKDSKILIDQLRAELKDKEKLIKQLNADLLKQKLSQNDRSQSLSELNQEILCLKTQMSNLSMDNKKKEFKLIQNEEELTKKQSKIEELNKLVNDLERLQDTQSTKLLSSKLGKDELARRLEQTEIQLDKKKKEFNELTERFNSHMISNQNTEKTLYDRIQELQDEVKLMKQLREEDKNQLQTYKRYLEQKDSKIMDKEEDIVKLANQLKKSQEDVTDKLSEIERLMKDIQNQSDQMEQLKRMSQESKEGQRQEYLQMIQDLKVELSDLKAKLYQSGIDSKDVIEQKEQAICDLKKQLGIVEKELNDLRKDILDLETVKGKLDQDMAGLSQVNDQLKNQSDGLQSSVKQKQSELERQQQEMATLRNQLMQSSKEDSGLKSQFQQLQEQLAKEVENLNQYRQQKDLMSQQIQQLMADKKSLQEQLAKEKQNQGGAKDREKALQLQISDLISEKKKIQYNLQKAEENVKESQKETRDAIRKYDDSYARFQESITKMGKLEQELTDQNETLMKRHKEINSLLKENKLYKDQIDGIRRKFGDLDDIQNKFDLALMKEQKVSDLLAELDHTMKSTENQLACYKCMNLLDDPVVLAPCSHVMCKKCVQPSQEKHCPQCSTKITQRLGPSDLITTLVAKFAFTRDAIDTFQNQAFWKNKLAQMKSQL